MFIPENMLRSLGNRIVSAVKLVGNCASMTVGRNIIKCITTVQMWDEKFTIRTLSKSKLNV